ncbi:MAG: metallophosphoesterase family protein [Chloroflexota bacterium]
MKLGLISDIHANAENLRRSLILLREKGAESILCAGDLVDGETEGNVAAQLIKSQNIPCVQGNHDHALSGATAANYAEWRRQWDEAELGFHPWQFSDDALTDETITYLRQLPLSLRFEWDNRRVLLTHASTWDQMSYIYANGRPAYLQRIAEEAQAADAEIVILGHTHVPMAVELEGVWIFNPGSVDGNRDQPFNATCALLDLAVMRYQVFDINTGRPTAYIFSKFGDLGHNMHETDGN